MLSAGCCLFVLLGCCVLFIGVCVTGCLWVGGFGSLGFHGDRLSLFVVVDLVGFREVVLR